MKREILNESERSEAVGGLDGWSEAGESIEKRWKFENFADALDFVNRVAAVAEAADHHPDIKLGWGYAEIASTTHDRGGVTDVDISVAAQIDALQKR